MRRRWLTIAVILTAPSGCDNVTWGGIHVGLEHPSAQDTAAARTAAGTAEAEDSTSLSPLPTGPLLFAGTRNGDRATLVVVGSVAGDSLEALPSDTEVPRFRERLTDEVLSPGTDLVLFSEGVRVGRMTVDSTGVDRRFCVARPTVTGMVELVPDASGAERLMALPEAAAANRPYEPYHHYQHNYDQRVASLNLAGAAINQFGARWPTALLEARADIQAFRVATTDAFAVTFLLSDRLAVSEPGHNAYSLFLIGTAGPGGYRSSYDAYRPAAEDGKGAPRYFDHLDWNGDGTPDILLDVFGARSRWFAGLAERDGQWVRTFEDPCGAPQPAG
ncbi:MAG: hypothetical protein LJF04_18635 [Gemmatimonadetes bacterium]|nr:hypothetical protein [Gemmatimonadota bacterium]